MIARLDGFQDYIYDHVTAKRQDPQDDMVSFLCDVHYEALDRKLTDIEIAGIVHAMIIGGLETTQYALEEQAQLLCENGGMFDRLREDRSKVRAFTEEAMRLRSPTHGLSTRITAKDEVFQGTEVPAGSLLHLRFGAANVDGDEFECPFDVDLDRQGVTRHVAFSAGPRVCPAPTCPGSSSRSPGACCSIGSSPSSTATTTTGCTSPASCSARLKVNVRFTKADPPMTLGASREPTLD